ncbi:beta-1,3-glucanase family protein [Pannonibacter sp. Pt2]|uniref:Beta-1,3-glucanase family protein n=1 Tax=Pannonibacter anstelovis TaxID=3121537 RepID=A0ABU7ZSX0_9HYPH
MSTSSVTLNLVNLRGAPTAPGEDIYILLTGENVTGLTGITLGTVTSLSQIPNAAISFTTIKSGRLYAGLGQFPNPPTPAGGIYYGWIEFSCLAAGDNLWINMSNVDLLGLPLSIAGTEAGGGSFSLGYKSPMTPTLLNTMKNSVLTRAGQGAVVTTASGQQMVIGPTVMPAAYPDMTPYVSSLVQAQTAVTIVSDTPPGGAPETFTGNFQAADPKTGVILSLKGDQGDTFELTAINLSSSIIYRCDGGTVIFNGRVVPQNRTATNDPSGQPASQIISNSVFRNLMIGFNEGYLTTAGPNNSSQFPGLTPFAGGNGNLYAQAIHNGTNSYGFPYADSNLKVLIQADPTQPVTVSILADSMAYGYSADPSGGSNQPSSGTYQFGIGAGSGALGAIRIGNWVYEPSANTAGSPGGAYGGFLPDLTEWTQMQFTGAGPDAYIWVKNGQISAGTCLNAAGSWNEGQTVYSWPANLQWVPGATAPAKPTS